MAQFYSMCSSVNTVSLKIKIKRKKNCKDNVHSRVCQIIIIMHRYLRHVATVLAAAAAAAVELALVHRRCMESGLDYACLIERLSLLIVSRTHRRRQRTPVPPQWSGPCRWQSPDDNASGPRGICYTAALCRSPPSPTTTTTTRQTVFHSVVITTGLHGTDVNCSCRLRYF